MPDTHPARVSVVADPPAGVSVAEVIPADRRLVAGLEAGPGARGACAVLIKVWKALRLRGQPLVLCVTDPVHETFRITGLIRLMPVFTELDPAVEAARAGGTSGSRA
jgi:hypothetical protein